MNESEGRVEIFYNNTWGTVCDNTWDLNDARVVCHYLGFSGALGAPRGAAFPSADLFAPIWLDQVYCTGFEEALDECPHGGYGDHLCMGGHNEDAGVICRGMRSTCVCQSICTQLAGFSVGTCMLLPHVPGELVPLLLGQRIQQRLIDLHLMY